MNRRRFLKTTGTISILSLAWPELFVGRSANTASRYVRPGDTSWPGPEKWNALRQQVSGRLLKLDSPFDRWKRNPQSPECAQFFKRLKNPYHIGDTPELTQTLGYHNAWTSATSAYAVAAANTADVVAAVNFAREHKVRLVVKGGGHSYQGTSNAPDSLLIWTRAMNKVELHDAFTPQGAHGDIKPQPAVSVGAGAIWKQAYDAVTTQGGRYVQGGGCTTVGVAGLISSGGFGSFSKAYGSAASALLEAEIVTAEGRVRVVNAHQDTDLFWALKGGGGGSFGVITRVTLRTRDLPEFFGATFGKIQANNDEAFERLITSILTFYRAHLMNPRWGEQIIFERDRVVRLSLVFHGLSQEEAAAAWKPFLDSIAAASADYTVQQPITSVHIPARHFWDAAVMKQRFPTAIISDDRAGSPASNTYWEGDHGQVGWRIHAYRSAWLPHELLSTRLIRRFAKAIAAASAHRAVSFHFNKGLYGASPENIAAAKNTATNPEVLNAFALAIIATGEQPCYPGIAGHEPDAAAAERNALQVNTAMTELLRVSPRAGSYVSESDYFERNWRRSFWGSNYRRLAAIKKRYDPNRLFDVHHGV